MNELLSKAQNLNLFEISLYKLKLKKKLVHLVFSKLETISMVPPNSQVHGKHLNYICEELTKNKNLKPMLLLFFFFVSHPFITHTILNYNYSVFSFLFSLPYAIRYTWI